MLKFYARYPSGVKMFLSERLDVALSLLGSERRQSVTCAPADVALFVAAEDQRPSLEVVRD